MSRSKRLKLLKAAIKLWIESEYQFRHGPNAFNGRTTERYLKASDLLREAMTGKQDIAEAAEAIGVEVARDKHIKKKAFKRFKKSGKSIGEELRLDQREEKQAIEQKAKRIQLRSLFD